MRLLGARIATCAPSKHCRIAGHRHTRIMAAMSKDQYASLALELADAAGEIIRPYFRFVLN